MKRKGLVTASILMALCLMTACGNGAMKGSSQAAPMVGSTSDSYAADEIGWETTEEAVMEEAVAEDYEASYENEAAAGGTQKPAVTPEQDPENGQKLIYTCHMTIETLTYEDTMTRVREAIREVGGFIEYESTSDSNYSWYYEDNGKAMMDTSLTIRVPAAVYDDFIASLEGSGGRVRSKDQSVENITAAYNDQSVLIAALETQEARLLNMMEQAETIEEMVTVESRLTEVQTELNQAKRALAAMDTDVTYSTVHLSIREVSVYEPESEESFGERLGRAFENGWINLVEVLGDGLVLLVVLLPFLLIGGGIAVLVVVLVKRAGKKKKAGQAPTSKEEDKKPASTGR
ncbi:MAG: DUF4349 domain-containing protein [Lachnospiraceae bacterium]|nr:DUF4349 domain-containing protein [Lachnospiraceae bacterium]